MNRDEFDIVGAILFACLGDGRLTSQIAADANMHFRVMRRRLDRLEHAGFIVRRADAGRPTCRYITTPPGLRFLEAIRKYRDN